MSALTASAPGPQRPSPLQLFRRHSDVALSATMGALVALLIMTLPLQAALATAVVGAFVLIALVDTRVALLALILVRASVDVSATVQLVAVGGSVNVNANALMSLLVIGLGIAHIALHRIDLRRIPLVTPFAAFVAITFAGLAFSPDIALSLQDWLRAVGALVVYILTVDLMRTHAERRWLLRMIVLSALIPVIVGLHQYVADTGNHDTPGYNRIIGTFVHPSPYAFYLVQIFPLALVLFLHAQSRVARLGLGALIPVMVFSIYATQTRGAWLGLVVMLAVFMWYRARWTIVLIPLFVAAAYFAVPTVHTRLGDITSGKCESVTYCESSVLWRTKQWEATLEVPSLPQLATVGAGLRSVDIVRGEFTHNEYVRLVAETGLLGLAATVILYVSLFRITRDGVAAAESPFKRDLMLAFMMTFLARVVMSGGDNLLVITVLEWYFWAFAAVIVVESGAYDRFARARENEERNRRSRIPAPRAAEAQA